MHQDAQDHAPSLSVELTGERHCAHHRPEGLEWIYDRLNDSGARYDEGHATFP
jgi:hypothetical protein